MFLVSTCSCLSPIHGSHVISWEWRCSCSSTDRRCSKYIWVINNFTAYCGATYIRDLTVMFVLILFLCEQSTINPFLPNRSLEILQWVGRLYLHITEVITEIGWNECHWNCGFVYCVHDQLVLLLNMKTILMKICCSPMLIEQLLVFNTKNDLRVRFLLEIYVVATGIFIEWYFFFKHVVR